MKTKRDLLYDLLDEKYQELREILGIESDSEEMELIYKIVALELELELECNK